MAKRRREPNDLLRAAPGLLPGARLRTPGDVETVRSQPQLGQVRSGTNARRKCTFMIPARRGAIRTPPVSAAVVSLTELAFAQGCSLSAWITARLPGSFDQRRPGWN